MDNEKLIEEYKKLPKICAETDYADKKSVTKNNRAVNRMYEIVGLLSQSEKGQALFFKLLNITDYKTNIWVATHLIEKMNPDKSVRKKALEIIKKVAKGDDSLALGYQEWLNEI